jgi:hypothetical protein
VVSYLTCLAPYNTDVLFHPSHFFLEVSFTKRSYKCQQIYIFHAKMIQVHKPTMNSFTSGPCRGNTLQLAQDRKLCDDGVSTGELTALLIYDDNVL